MGSPTQAGRPRQVDPGNEGVATKKNGAHGVCACAYSNPLHLPILSLDLYILSLSILSHYCTCLPTVDTCTRYKQSSSSSSLTIAIRHSSRIHRYAVNTLTDYMVLVST